MTKDAIAAVRQRLAEMQQQFNHSIKDEDSQKLIADVIADITDEDITTTLNEQQQKEHLRDEY